MSLFLCFIPLLVCVQSQSNLQDINRLTEHLFSNNRINVHTPPTTANDSVKVEFSISLNSILEVDDFEGSIRANIWMKLAWQDSQLKWNESEYGGVTILKLPSDLVWKPDITLYNSATAKEMHPLGNANILVYPDGKVLWIPPATTHSTCKLDHKYYPYDEQLCNMIYGSWVHSHSIIELSIYGHQTTIDLNDYEENALWDIKSTSAILNIKVYECCLDEKYPSINFSMTLRRRSPYFKTLLITPPILAMLLTLTVFCIPSPSATRIKIGAFTSMFLLIHLIYLGFKVPMGGTHAPLIFIFCNGLFVMSALSIIITVVVHHIEGRSNQIRLPRTLEIMTKGFVGRVLFLGSVTYQVGHDRGVELLDVEPGQDKCDLDRELANSKWKMAAAAIDRLILALYCLIYCAILLSYLA